ncbi:hypothetical protein LWI29_025147 [Acer saccharum]|uniref:Uncharacterized protein n=1 Tax=Acer saccharum TaxID=4024 RepID=A0AA39T5Y4_ACESA|nr:hypothetical protein LWI29_025147 [Acer saccharum]
MVDLAADRVLMVVITLLEVWQWRKHLDSPIVDSTVEGGPRASMNNIIKSRSAQKHESNQGGPDQRHRWSKSKSTALKSKEEELLSNQIDVNVAPPPV